MRIVSRETFLTLPSGTIFAKFGGPEGSPNDAFFGEVAIKGDTCGSDFIVQDLTAQFEGWTGSESHFDELCAISDDETHEAPPLDYDSAGRDGLFDSNQRFAVWSREDAVRLLSRLQAATMTDRPHRILARAHRHQLRGETERLFKLRILADEPIVEWGPEVVHGPGDVRNEGA